MRRDLRAREMAQQLLTHPALAEDSGSVPSTHIRQPQLTISLVPGLYRCLHIHAHTHEYLL